MMQDLAGAAIERRRRILDGAEAMVSALGARDELSDSEAFALLRRRFPQAALCERVAAVARWRLGA